MNFDDGDVPCYEPVLFIQSFFYAHVNARYISLARIASAPSSTRFLNCSSAKVTNCVLMPSVTRHLPFSRKDTSNACMTSYDVLRSLFFFGIVTRNSVGFFRVHCFIMSAGLELYEINAIIQCRGYYALDSLTSSGFFNASTDAFNPRIFDPSGKVMSTRSRPFSSVLASVRTQSITVVPHIQSIYFRVVLYVIKLHPRRVRVCTEILLTHHFSCTIYECCNV